MEFSQFSGSREDSVGSNGDYDRTTAPTAGECERPIGQRPAPLPRLPKSASGKLQLHFTRNPSISFIPEWPSIPHRLTPTSWF